MYGETRNTESRNAPLPPARTRWSTSGETASQGGFLLGPVRSGLFGRPVSDSATMDSPETAEPAEPLWTETPPAIEPESEVASEVGETFEAELEMAGDIEAEMVVEAPADSFEAALEPEPEHAHLADSAWPETEAVIQPEELHWVEAEEHDTDAEEVQELAGWATADLDDGLVELAATASEDIAGVLDADEEELPWDDTPQTIEFEESELVLEMDMEADDEMEFEAGGLNEMTIEIEAIPEDPPEGLQAVGDLLEAGEGMQPRPAPLSAWELGSAAPAEAAPDRFSRAMEEWESLGKALAESIQTGGDIRPLAELTDETDAAQADAEPDAMELQVEGLQPICAGPLRDEPAVAAETGSAALTELSERLEAFAAALRTEGRYAITRAQLSGDRMDSMLAGFAAGWLAARGE